MGPCCWKLILPGGLVTAGAPERPRKENLLADGREQEFTRTLSWLLVTTRNSAGGEEKLRGAPCGPLFLSPIVSFLEKKGQGLEQELQTGEKVGVSQELGGEKLKLAKTQPCCPRDTPVLKQ